MCFIQPALLFHYRWREAWGIIASVSLHQCGVQEEWKTRRNVNLFSYRSAIMRESRGHWLFYFGGKIDRTRIDSQNRENPCGTYRGNSRGASTRKEHNKACETWDTTWLFLKRHNTVIVSPLPITERPAEETKTFIPQCTLHTHPILSIGVCLYFGKYVLATLILVRLYVCVFVFLVFHPRRGVVRMRGVCETMSIVFLKRPWTVGHRHGHTV